MLHNSERGLLTVNVLELNYALSLQISELFLELGTEPSPDGEWNDRDVDRLAMEIRDKLYETRDGIAAELVLAPMDEEEEELHRLAEISHYINILLDRLERMEAETGTISRGSLSSLLSNPEVNALRGLLHEAIVDEKGEILLSRQRQRSFSSRAQIFLFVALIPLAGSFVAGFVLLMRYEAYFILVLQKIERIRNGDYGAKIPVQKETTLNQLTDQIHSFTGFLQNDNRSKTSERQKLEGRIDDQTREIEALQLALARKEQVRRDLFADVSHELRTPITVIQGEAEVCLRSPQPTLEEFRMSLERICEQASLSGRIVNDLLMIARADANALRLKLERCSLSELLLNTLRSFKSLVDKNGVAMEVDLSELNVDQMVDARRLGQAFSILLDNAIRYTPDKGRIWITGHAEVGSIIIQITNTVCKGTKIDFDRLFERFYRGESADATRRGSGLGLPVAKAIVESHNGSLEVVGLKETLVRATIRLPVPEIDRIST